MSSREFAFGASPDDVARLVAMVRVVGQFGHQLGRICDDCAAALEDLAPPATPGTHDEAAQQRPGDDGGSSGD